ncbi:hypothetical protein BpHYR1_034351, partial [Brachionus plicatilis]
NFSGKILFCCFINNVKRNTLAIEKVSYETPKPSNEAVQSQSIQVVFYVNCVVSWGKRNIFISKN